MEQEPDTEPNIKKYIERFYGLHFPVFSKINVNGFEADPVFKYLRRNSELYHERNGTAKEIPWNFTKFLVNKDGHVLKYIDPREKIDKIRPLIEEIILRAE